MANMIMAGVLYTKVKITEPKSFTDLTLRNNENQTPLDLCQDQSLSEAISKWHVPRPRLVIKDWHYYLLQHFWSSVLYIFHHS